MSRLASPLRPGGAFALRGRARPRGRARAWPWRGLLGAGLVLGLVALMLLVAWVRFAPLPMARWHVNPLTAPDPAAGFARIVPGEIGEPAGPAVLALRLDQALMAMPGMKRLAGRPAEGFVTYLQRQGALGAADLVTVRVISTDRGATCAVLMRAVQPWLDLGGNRRRAAALRAALAAAE